MKAVHEMNKSKLLDFYRQMFLIRVFEERSSEQYMLGNIRGFLHLYIGEEAIAVGAIAALRPDDYVVTHYRDHGHALARGIDTKAVMAELFGKATGCSGGKGGSMHLFDASKNFMGGYAIVGGQLPIAVGLAHAASYKGEDRVVLCFLGDGALNEGEFHEAMNMAAIWKLPVLFLCENNLYGMGSPVSEVFATREIYKAAEPYGIPSAQVDGMDVLKVHEVTRDALAQVRAGGPFFLEALTYRFRGHSMADPAEYRRKAEEEQWMKKDPVPIFKRYLVESSLATAEDIARIEAEVERDVEEAIRFAGESPYPPQDALSRDVYKESEG